MYTIINSQKVHPTFTWDELEEGEAFTMVDASSTLRIKVSSGSYLFLGSTDNLPTLQKAEVLCNLTHKKFQKAKVQISWEAV